MKVKDNCLLAFNMENPNKLQIVKMEFDANEKDFKRPQIIENYSNLTNFSKILVLDNEYVAIINNNNMIILNI